MPWAGDPMRRSHFPFTKVKLSDAEEDLPNDKAGMFEAILSQRQENEHQPTRLATLKSPLSPHKGDGQVKLPSLHRLQADMRARAHQRERAFRHTAMLTKPEQNWPLSDDAKPADRAPTGKRTVLSKRKAAGPVLTQTIRNGQVQLRFHKTSAKWSFEAYKKKDDTVEWANKQLQQ